MFRGFTGIQIFNFRFSGVGGEWGKVGGGGVGGVAFGQYIVNVWAVGSFTILETEGIVLNNGRVLNVCIVFVYMY